MASGLVARYVFDEKRRYLIDWTAAGKEYAKLLVALMDALAVGHLDEELWGSISFLARFSVDQRLGEVEGS